MPDRSCKYKYLVAWATLWIKNGAKRHIRPLYMCGSGGKTKFLGEQNFLFFIFIFLFSIFSPECGIAQLSLSLFVSSSLGFSPECGIAQLSLSLFVSSSWSTLMTSIIFRCDSISRHTWYTGHSVRPYDTELKSSCRSGLKAFQTIQRCQERQYISNGHHSHYDHHSYYGHYNHYSHYRH